MYPSPNQRLWWGIIAPPFTPHLGKGILRWVECDRALDNFNLKNNRGAIAFQVAGLLHDGAAVSKPVSRGRLVKGVTHLQPYNNFYF